MDAITTNPRDTKQTRSLSHTIASAINIEPSFTDPDMMYDERPWGCFQVYDADDDFKLKKIFVKPGGRLSLQRHKYRDEHWYVVNGLAVVTRDGVEIVIQKGESIDITRGMSHRLLNPGPGELTLIEVQTGEYFGEDDIERLEDDYGRR